MNQSIYDEPYNWILAASVAITKLLIYVIHMTTVQLESATYRSNGSQYNDQGVYCGLSTASEVLLVLTTQLVR